MRDLGIVFMHHEVTGITAEHLKLIKKNNPGELIVTVSQHPRGHIFPDGYALVNMPTLNNLWNNITHGGEAFDRAWLSSDIAICSWYAGKWPEHQAKRWVITEWDVKCVDTSFREFWQPSWDEHFTSLSTHRYEDCPDWLWYQRYAPHVPEKFKPHISGAFGFCGMLLSDEAFSKLSELMGSEWFECFSEIRFSTFARYLGYDPKSIPSMVGNIAPGADYLTQDINTKGIWHPVKGH